MKRPAAALAVLGASALGAGALLWSADAQREGVRALAAPSPIPAVTQPRLERRAAEPARSTRSAPEVPETPEAIGGAAPAPALERADRVRTELARLFSSEPFDRVAFDRAVRALAAPLDARDGERLRASLSHPGSSLEDSLAACELLRELEERGTLERAELPDAVRAALRAESTRLARAADPAPLAESAARALAASTADGARVLLAELLGSAGEVRERCARALVYARGPSAATELARALPATADARSLELVTVALGAVLRRTRDELAPDVRLEIGAELEDLVRSDRGGVRRRALVALAELDPGRAPELLELAADDEIALIVSAEERSALTLEPTLLDARSTPARRVAAAEALARARETAGAPALAAARDTLLACAESDADPVLRRRALHALGTLGDPAALPVVADVARFDPDVALRAADLRSLAELGDRGTLAVLAEADSCPELRALAAQELARLP